MIVSAKVRPVRLAAILATVCAAGLIAGFQNAAAPPAVAPPPPPPAPAEAPTVLLPAKVLEAASVYTAYVSKASAMSAAFTSGESVAASLRVGEGYETHQMQRGLTAYAAIVALQDPTFVASVRKFGADPIQRAQVAAALLADPRYATVFHGADSAAGLIIAALRQQGQQLVEAGARVKQAAYDVQHQKWSTGVVADREGRLAMAKALASSPQSAAAEDQARLQLASTGATPLAISGAAADGPYSATVDHGLAIAAMAALGDGGEDFSDQLVAMLAEGDEDNCLSMAKLNLYQCLAVSKPHYEDVFCLGRHILMDTGECIIRGSTARGGPPALIAVADPAPAPPVKAKKAVSKKKRKAAAS